MSSKLLNIDLNQLEATMVERIGINLVSGAGVDEKGTYFDFQPTDLEPSEGFLIRVRVGWRNLTAEFIPGRFAARLIQSMELSDNSKKVIFKALAGSATSQGDMLQMKVNHLLVDPLKIEQFKDNWKMLSLQLKRIPIYVDLLSRSELTENILTLGGALLAMVISLLPLEKLEVSEHSILPYELILSNELLKNHIAFSDSGSLEQDRINQENATAVYQYNELDTQLFRLLYEEVNTSRSNDEKKHSMENMAEYLVGSILGFVLSGRNSRTTTGEIDRTFRNDAIYSPTLHTLGPLIQVECKNTNKPIDPSEIADFSRILRDIDSNAGFYFTRKGVTGNSSRDGWRTILDLWSHERRRILVFDDSHYKRILEGEPFITMVLEQYQKVTMKLGKDYKFPAGARLF